MAARKKAILGDPKTDAAPDSAVEQKAETLTKQKRRQKGKSLSPPYIPTDCERDILSKQYERLNAEPPIPSLKVVREYDELAIVPDHPDRDVG